MIRLDILVGFGINARGLLKSSKFSAIKDLPVKCTRLSEAAIVQLYTSYFAGRELFRFSAANTISLQ